MPEMLTYRHNNFRNKADYFKERREVFANLVDRVDVLSQIYTVYGSFKHLTFRNDSIETERFVISKCKKRKLLNVV